jgi:hypothetical protein
MDWQEVTAGHFSDKSRESYRRVCGAQTIAGFMMLAFLARPFGEGVTGSNVR